jgi:hypothetical protein
MKTLIVNADDLGYDPAVTRGIVQSMREGIVTSATYMVNTPFSAEAAPEARGLSLGLHLNLARHPPLWGGFPPKLLGDGALVESRVSELPADVVAHEVRAQLDMLQRYSGRPATHIDVHKHLHQYPDVLAGLSTVAKERALPVRSIDAQMRAALTAAGVRTNPHFIGDAGGDAYWTLETLERELRALPDGLTELMCHPGYRPEKTKSGYAAQREVELATFIHPRARELIAELGIQLADFTAI